MFHNSVIFRSREKNHTNQPPNTSNNDRGLLSNFFLKLIFNHFLATTKYNKFDKSEKG